MQEQVTLLREPGLPIVPQNPNPRIVIQNESKPFLPDLHQTFWLR